ncbi:hypothetical protein Ae201684P_008899 [Aphanomyces euteiches]|nr:hypothetical protein Ae201684P_008899 [Aphanomyces euteiches]
MNIAAPRKIDAETEAFEKRKQRFRAVQNLTVEGGIENTFRSRFPAVDSKFWSVFYEACAAGEKWTAHRHLLISYSLPQTINSEDNYVSRKDHRLVTILLGIKGDPWVFNQKGWSAVTAAVVYNHVALVKLFAASGVKLDRRDDRLGYTPAHFAVQTSNVSMLRLLEEKGANLAVAAKNGYTLLHTAAEVGAEECIEFLLKNRLIPMDARDSSQETACHKAARRSQCRILDLFKQHGASFRSENLDMDSVSNVQMDDLHMTRPMERNK